jgi:hypothetical protein
MQRQQLKGLLWLLSNLEPGINELSWPPRLHFGNIKAKQEEEEQ